MTEMISSFLLSFLYAERMKTKELMVQRSLPNPLFPFSSDNSCLRLVHRQCNNSFILAFEYINL